MSQNPDVVFTTEYIKNVLYFATVKLGKTLQSTSEVHYFCIDNDLLYENYYSDFGPLNLGCVYRYCKILNEKLNLYLNKQKIVHYTSVESRAKTNAAFLLGCFGVLHLKMSPRDALKPLIMHGHSYRHFQDATKGDSMYTISILDCLCAIKKARTLNFFDFLDFNFDEYERLDKIQGGDLNWIVPGKFLAFIGPVDYSVSLFHPPEMYIEYFKENNVQIVIRLNKRMYDAEVFLNAGIQHYDLFFPDGSCPPRHILMKFLQISEESEAAIAVHCKAGLGRTGSLIGSYLIKHYRMTAHEAIGWMRICRPGSVIGYQQTLYRDRRYKFAKRVKMLISDQVCDLNTRITMVNLCAALISFYRHHEKRQYGDPEKLPVHEFGVYSIAEKMLKQRPQVYRPSSPKDREKHSQSEISRSDISSPISVVLSKTAETEQHERRLNAAVRSKTSNTGRLTNSPKLPRAQIGAGEPRAAPMMSRSTSRNQTSRGNINPFDRAPIPTFRTSQGPMVKTLSDAKVSCNVNAEPQMALYFEANPNNSILEWTFLMRTSAQNQLRERNLMSSMTVTPFNKDRRTGASKAGSQSPRAYEFVTPVSRPPVMPLSRRRALGRSPSPSPPASPDRQPLTQTKLFSRGTEATSDFLKDALSRLTLVDGNVCRNGSIGAYSMGAARDAPHTLWAPSVRSDERPLATQGDMLNSIKFQKRFPTFNFDTTYCRIPKQPPTKQDRGISAPKPTSYQIWDHSTPLKTNEQYCYTTMIPPKREHLSTQSSPKRESHVTQTKNSSTPLTQMWERPSHVKPARLAGPTKSMRERASQLKQQDSVQAPKPPWDRSPPGKQNHQDTGKSSRTQSPVKSRDRAQSPVRQMRTLVKQSWERPPATKTSHPHTTPSNSARGRGPYL